MKIITRAIFWTTAALLAVVCLITTGGYLWLNSANGRNWLLNRIDTVIPGRISVKAHHLSPLAAQLDLFDAVLYDPGGDIVAGIDRLHVDAAWWPLLRREVRLTDIRVEAPRLNLATDAAGRLNLMAALVFPDGDTSPPGPADDAGMPVNIVCPRFRLSDGRLTFSTPDSGREMAVSGIDIAGSGNLAARRAAVEMDVAHVRVTAPGFHLQPARLHLKANLDDATLALDGVRLSAGHSALTLDGRVAALFSSPDIDARLSLRGPLGELRAAAGLTDLVTGSLTADLGIHGSPANPDADLSLDLAHGRIPGLSLDRATARLTLNDRQVTLHQATLQQADGSLTVQGTSDLREVFPAGFLKPPANLDAITYSLQLAGRMPDIRPWLTALTDMGGGADGRASITGRGLRLPAMTATAAVRASATRLNTPEMAEPVDARLSLEARMTAGTLAVDHLDIATEGIQLSGGGRYRTGDGGLTGRLSLAANDLAPGLAVAGLPAVTGSGRATIDIGGTLAHPQLSADLTTRDLSTGSFTIGSLTAAARMASDGDIDVETLTLQNGASHISGNARLRLLANGGLDPAFNNAVELQWKTVSIADFMKSPPLEGRFDGRLQLGGTPSSPTAVLELTGRDIRGQGAGADRLDADLRLANDHLTIDRLRLQRRTSSITAGGDIALLVPGSLRLTADPAFDLTVDANRFDPADFYPGPVGGRLALAGRLTGSLDAPAGTFHLTGEDLDIAGQPVARVDIAGQFRDRRLWIDPFVADIAPDAALTVTGSIGLDRTLDLAARAEKIPVARIEILRDIVPGDGRLDLTATAGGRLENPDIDGRLTVSEVMLGDQRVDDIHLDVSLHDMQARAVGRLNFALDAACNLRGGDFDARLKFDRTELAAYFKAAGQPALNGTLTGRVNARGNIRNMAGAVVDANVNRLRLFHGTTPLVRSEGMALNLAGGLLSVPSTRLQVFSTGRIDLSGQARLGGAVDFSVDGRVPLANLAVLDERLGDLAGGLTLSAKLAGTVDKPQIDARVDLEKVSMTVPGTAQRIQNLNGRLSLTDARLGIDRLTGRLDTGTFSLEGTVDHDRFSPTHVDLTAHAQALPIEVPDTISLLLNGDVRLTGNQRRADARGKITILEGLYDRDVKINLLTLAAARQRHIEPETPPLTVPWFETVLLDIDVGYRQPFLVENNLAQLEIAPDLKLGGSLARPILSGRAQVRSGTLTFQGKTFDVKKGVVDFVNPYKTQARIDIESQATISAWTVFLSIQGTPDNLDLKLSSVPEQTPADILSIILFGKPTAELVAGGGGGKRTTSQIMAEMIADTFGEDIKKRVGVDILEVTSTADDTAGNGTTQEGAGGVKVTVGEHLSDRMTVKYSVETKAGEVVQRAITEYQLLEHLLVSGFQDTQGVYGSELVLRIEFR